MYNGIGLMTARGSGTNGFVTRNIALLRNGKQDRVDYKSEEELKKLDAQLNKKPNQEILEHERKRKVELKCMEMYELMEEQGYSKDEIDRKVTTFRKMLMQKEGVSDKPVEKDEAGRPIVSGTHQEAEANQQKNTNLRAAFGLSEYYVDGSSLDPNRKAKEDEAKAVAMAQKKYALVREESASPSPERKPKKKKSKKRRSRSPSESRERSASHKKRKRRHRSSRDE